MKKRKTRKKPAVQVVRNAWSRENYWNKAGAFRPKTTSFRSRKYTKRTHMMKI